MATNYVLKGDKYSCDYPHPDATDRWDRDDTEKFQQDTGATDDQVYHAFNMDKGQKITIKGRKFECIKCSVGKSNGFTTPLHYILREC